MRECSYCKQMIEDDTLVCKFCQQPVSKKSLHWGLFLFIVLIVATLVLGGLLLEKELRGRKIIPTRADRKQKELESRVQNYEKTIEGYKKKIYEYEKTIKEKEVFKKSLGPKGKEQMPELKELSLNREMKISEGYVFLLFVSLGKTETSPICKITYTNTSPQAIRPHLKLWFFNAAGKQIGWLEDYWLKDSLPPKERKIVEKEISTQGLYLKKGEEKELRYYILKTLEPEFVPITDTLPAQAAKKSEMVRVDLSSELHLGGIIYEKGKESFVIINNEMLKRGDSIKGFLISDITPKEVILSKEGQEYSLSTYEEE